VISEVLLATLKYFILLLQCMWHCSSLVLLHVYRSVVYSHIMYVQVAYRVMGGPLVKLI
jgi:hypothetical protein